MRALRPTLLALSFLALLPAARAESPGPELDHIDGETLVLKGLKPIATHLKDLKYLGLIKNEGASYVVVTGKNCAGNDCLEDRAVWLIPTEGTHKSHQFIHPGKIVDPKSGVTLLDSRAFFGRCVPGSGELYIAFQKDLVEKKRHKRRYKSVEPSTYTAEPFKDGLKEKLTEIRSIKTLASHQRATLARVKQKTCFEIDGRNRNMLAKPLDLKPRHEGDDADDEDDSPDSDTGDDAAPSASPTQSP